MKIISINKIDIQLLYCIFILILFGVVMLYSASSAISNNLFTNDTFFLSKHISRLLIGLFFMFLFLFINYKSLKNIAIYLVIFSFILIIYGHLISQGNTTARWLIINGNNWLTISDFSKLSLIIFTAWYLEKYYKKIDSFYQGILPVIIPVGITILGIAKQPDFSTSISISIILLTMLFIGGARLKHLLLIIFYSLPIILFSLYNNNYQWNRIISWLNQSENILSSNWQSHHSLLGLGNGGLFGRGLGNSIIKYPGFLPEVQTDFIFSVIGEELGFLGITIILFCFFWLFYRGITIAKNAPDAFGMYLACGIILNITIYALININYVIGILPTTGLPLPFFSYGGSHTLFTLLSLGILLNISCEKSVLHARQGIKYYG